MTLFPLGLLGQPRGAAAGGFGYHVADSGAIRKIDSSSDTISTSSATLSVFNTNGVGSGGLSNSGVAAYYAANVFGTTVDKIAFPADTRTTLATGISQVRGAIGGMANVAVAGYFGGGVDSNGSTWYTTVDKFAFPADTRSTLGTGLSVSMSNNRGCANSGTAGYYTYGQTNGGSNSAYLQKFVFSTDTNSSNASYFPSATISKGFAANKGVAAYGGTDKIAFPTDTRSAFAPSGSGHGSQASSINGLLGYFVTAFSGTGANKVLFATETGATLGSSFPTNMSYIGDGFGNSGVF
jgi:hypothetical protein